MNMLSTTALHLSTLVLVISTMLAWQAVAAGHVTSHYWTRDQSSDDQLRTAAAVASLRGDDLSSRVCALRCQSHGSCRSFALVNTSVCLLYRFPSLVSSQFLPLPGTRNFNLEGADFPDDCVLLESSLFCFQLRHSPQVDSWDRARADCQSRGEDLVVLDNDAKMTAVAALVLSNYTYAIGLHRDTSSPAGMEEDWFWVDGTPYIFDQSHWISGDPNLFWLEGCVFLWAGCDAWLNNVCTLTIPDLRYFCERKL